MDEFSTIFERTEADDEASAGFVETATVKLLAVANLNRDFESSLSLPVNDMNEAADYLSDKDDNNNPLFVYQYPLLVWALTIAYVLILATSVVANLITISYYFMNRNSQLIANPYVLSLIIADVIWPFVNVPLNVVNAWTPFWILGETACHVMPYSQVVFPEIISFTLCAIAVERYFTIIHPFRANPMLSPIVAAVTICCIWFVPLIGNGFLIWAHRLTPSSKPAAPVMCMPSESFMGPQEVTTFKIIQSAIVLVFIPAILFPFCYGQIVLRVIRSQVKLTSRNFSSGNNLDQSDHHIFAPAKKTSSVVQLSGSAYNSSNNNNSKPQQPQQNNQLRSAPERRTRVVTMISVMGQLAHFTCWTPIVAFQLWHVANNYPLLSANQLITYKLLTLLASANPAWNSLSYTAILRHRALPHQNRSFTSNASTFSLLAFMVRQSNNNNTNNNNSISITNHRARTDTQGSNGPNEPRSVQQQQVNQCEDLSYNNNMETCGIVLPSLKQRESDDQ